LLHSTHELSESELKSFDEFINRAQLEPDSSSTRSGHARHLHRGW
jgi:hypothetical protein